MQRILTHATALLLILPAALRANPVPGREFNVRQYGALGDGRTLDTVAIQKAIDAASSSGGGTVVFPPGTYLSGSLRLQSRVTLEIGKDATLLGSPIRTGYQKANFLRVHLFGGGPPSMDDGRSQTFSARIHDGSAAHGGHADDP